MARVFGNENVDWKSGPGCPILFYKDGELQDISAVEENSYLYGGLGSDHSVKLDGYNKIKIVHKTELGSISEGMLELVEKDPVSFGRAIGISGCVCPLKEQE